MHLSSVHIIIEHYAPFTATFVPCYTYVYYIHLAMNVNTKCMLFLNCGLIPTR